MCVYESKFFSFSVNLLNNHDFCMKTFAHNMPGLVNKAHSPTVMPIHIIFDMSVSLLMSNVLPLFLLTDFLSLFLYLYFTAKYLA